MSTQDLQSDNTGIQAFHDQFFRFGERARLLQCRDSLAHSLDFVAISAIRNGIYVISEAFGGIL